MAAVNVSHTPSSISLTVVARNRPPPARSRRASRSSTWPRPRPRSHHSAPVTWQLSTPSAAAWRVGIERVWYAEFGGGADAGVLEPGDPQRVQVRLGREQPGPKLRRAGRRDLDQPHGAVVQHAGGPAGPVAFDPPVGRVRGARVEAGQLQRGGVDPGAVVIAVGQERGPAAGDRVQVRGGGQAAGERRHGPAAAQHPGAGGPPGTVGGHRGQGVLPGPQAQQVAPQALQAAGHRVHVRVAERGQHEPSPQVDHAGAAAGQRPDVLVRSDGLDQAAADGQRLGEPRRVHGRADLPAGQDQLGRAAACRHSPHPNSAAPGVPRAPRGGLRCMR